MINKNKLTNLKITIMRLSKLMLSALVAVFALVSCTKENHTPESTSLKTVQLSLENVILTKGMAGDKISANQKVAVNDFKIFLTDDSYSPSYSAKNADGSAATFYFNSSSDLSAVKEFHYVDHKCTKVVVVANAGNISFEDVMNLKTEIKNQQDQKSLILYGEEDLSATGRVHTNSETDKYTEVYEAEVMLKPTIARFEVDGFVTKFSSNPNFDKVSVTAIAFQHYLPALSVSTENGKLSIAGSGNHVLAISDLEDQAQVFNWFNGSASTGWFVDKFNPALEMTPSAPKADTPNNLAYHFFAGEIVPQMIITLLADNAPAYVYTSKFSKGNEYLTQLEAGKIYRMSAPGLSNTTDGSIEIPDDLSPIQRCLEVTVEVVDWTVDIITPEF